jgi:hypothetical protein
MVDQVLADQKRREEEEQWFDVDTGLPTGSKE